MLRFRLNFSIVTHFEDISPSLAIPSPGARVGKHVGRGTSTIGREGGAGDAAAARVEPFLQSWFAVGINFIQNVSIMSVK